MTSSNGERETRYVISTPIRIGDREWPIEVTLTNRDAMSYRMLLGRQAIGGGILVDPASSFRQPRLRYKLYEPAGRRDRCRPAAPRPWTARGRVQRWRAQRFWRIATC